MDPETALAMMWSIADKPERLRCFHKIVFDLNYSDPKGFWQEFWHIWTTSENLNEDADHIIRLVAHGMTIAAPRSGLKAKDRKKLAALPKRVTVYRGGTRANQRGWSWTTDREMAKFFANRAVGSTERIISKLVVDKRDVLAYLGGRNESEIVLDPAIIGEIEIDEVFEVEDGGRAALFYAVQSGRLSFGGDRVSAEMMAITIPHAAIEKNIADIAPMLEFARWAELGKRGYFEALIEVLREKFEQPPTGEPVTFSL